MTTFIHPKWQTGRLRSAILFFISSLFFAQFTFAQVASPYSRYGLGTLEPDAFSANTGMGNLAAPYLSTGYINAANPASYASLNRTTIEIGANLSGSGIRTLDSSYGALGGGLNHFAIAFVPYSKHNNWAVSIGLLPYSNMSYNFTQNINDSLIGPYNQVNTGQGSLYKLYVGAAYRVNGFSIGANVGYIFGKLTYEKRITFPDTGTTGAYNTRNVTNMNVKGFFYTVGLAYQKLIYKRKDQADFRHNIYVMAGVYGTSGVKLNAKVSSYWDRFTYDASGNIIVVDTVQYGLTQQGKITMPFNLGAGLMFGNEAFWLLGADFKFSNWQDYSSPINNGQLTNSWMASIGGQIIPKSGDRKFGNNVQYRVGAYVGKSEVTFLGNNLNQYAATFGVGLPLKKVAVLNVSGQVGSRGGSTPEVVRENFYRFTVGLVLNDVWFIKRKFD